MYHGFTQPRSSPSSPAYRRSTTQGASSEAVPSALLTDTCSYLCFVYRKESGVRLQTAGWTGEHMGSEGGEVREGDSRKEGIAVSGEH